MVEMAGCEVILGQGREWWFAAQGGLCPTQTPFCCSPPTRHVSQGNRAEPPTPATATPTRVDDSSRVRVVDLPERATSLPKPNYETNLGN